MAYLHEDANVFTAVITQAAQKLGVPEAIVEKDYYVTVLLRELAMQLPYIVFKGGTSLSKAHKIIKRFSEDIDLASDKNLTQGEKKKLKNSVVEAADKLGLNIQNLEETRSRRQFNRYIIAYPDRGYPSAIMPSVIIETPLMALAEPVQKMPIESLIAEAIRDEAPDLIRIYEEDHKRRMEDIRWSIENEKRNRERESKEGKWLLIIYAILIVLLIILISL
jgi:hypothetical protein